MRTLQLAAKGVPLYEAQPRQQKVAAHSCLEPPAMLGDDGFIQMTSAALVGCVLSTWLSIA